MFSQARNVLLALLVVVAAVVVLVRLQGLGHAEAARRMGRTESATRTLLSRALARLATELELTGTEESPEAGHAGS